MNDTKRKHILLTNDDGYSAKGINTLYEALIEHFDVTICAPKENESAHSHSITINKPVHAQEFEKGFHVTGTPVDAVHLALADLITKPVDYVISGINQGANLGDDYYYSGTIAAAREAAFYSYTSFALSMHNFESSVAKRHAEFFTQYLLSHANEFVDTTLYSFNFPETVAQDVERCPLGRYIREKMPLEKFKSKRTEGSWYWIGQLERGHFDDFKIIESGKIALTVFDFKETILGKINPTASS